MPERGEGVAIVNLKDLGHPLPHAHEQNALGPRDRKHRRAAFELVADVFAAVADGFKPTIGFLCHAEASFQQRSCSSIAIERVPSASAA